MMLEAQKLVAGYGKTAIVREVDLCIPEGQVSVIIGGNGCGKSTLLKTMARLLRPMGGAVLLDGRAVHDMPTKELAQKLALLPQSPLVPDGICVADLVARGRYPHRSPMQGLQPADYEAVAEALELMGISELAGREVAALSGGQRQRVWIAMALAQQTDILLLDEPTTYLDIAYQVEILDTLRELNSARGITIVMVLHDINLSARYADHLFAMGEGRLVREGAPADVITQETMREIFGISCQVLNDPVSGTPFVIPEGRYRPVA